MFLDHLNNSSGQPPAGCYFIIDYCRRFLCHKAFAKAVAQGVSDFIVGMATGVATSGHKISGRMMKGALIDLESGELTWSNAVRAGGNPINPDVWLDTVPLDLLFHDLLFHRLTEQ